MSFAQALAVQVEFDQVRGDFVVPLQQARLPLGVIDQLAHAATSPDDLRRRIVGRLQATLPKTEPASVRAELSRAAPADEIRSTEQKVRSAIERQAHHRADLTPVVSRDRTGREITEFFGEKKSWMSQFEALPQIMTRLGAVTY